MYIRINKKFVAPVFALVRPLRPFRADIIDTIVFRRLLTEIAILGVGTHVGVIQKSVTNVEEALIGDSILRLNFDLPNNKRYSPEKGGYPTPYADISLEPDYTKKTALDCDLTFWAVQFLYLCCKFSISHKPHTVARR